MPVVERVIPVPPGQVFAILRDGWSYSDWVVGTQHIRDVDDDWPRPGASLYHTLGPWPFIAIKGRSMVLTCDEPYELSLRAGLWPAGEAHVTFKLTPLEDGSTRVTFSEEFSAGPLLTMRNRLNDLILSWRNREALRRLADLAVNRGSTTSAGEAPRREPARSHW
ncbi:MAG TPA: SRPBCC family protein [Micromonospora sp.]